MIHEGNSEVKESKAPVIIHKYNVFRINEEESVEERSFRSQMLAEEMRRTKDNSEADFTSNIESDTDQEEEVLSFLIISYT